MPFDNASGDASLDPLGTGLQAMLTTDLAGASAFSLVERARLAAIQSELALAKTAAIDPATAAKVGKLAGASHLIAGAVTVVAATMRLDARLFEVATGKVLVTAKIEGEKDAFFELEKQLVQQIIDATQAKVTAKERATIARIHTSDFGAFARFSEGVFAFDHQDYERAIQALKDAANMDDEFKLAELTLDDYGLIVQKLQARAQLIDANERKMKALAADKVVRDQQPIFDALWKIAKVDKGGDDARRDRIAALYQLAHLYGDINNTTRDKVGLRRFEDRWLMDRTSDNLCKAYHAEAIAAWPLAPAFVTADFGFQVPLDPKTYSADEAEWLAHFFGHDDRRDALNVQRELIDDLQRDSDFAVRLHLDGEGHARLVERAYQLGKKLDLAGIDAKYQSRKNWWSEQMAGRLGSLFRQAGLLDESTKYFAESGRLASESYAVKGAASEVERNKATAAFLKAHPSPLVHEWLLARGNDLGSADDDYRTRVVAALEQKPVGVVGRSALANARMLSRNGDFRFVLVNDTPVWPLDNGRFTTGARSGVRRASSFGYYRGKRQDADIDPYIALVGEQQARWKTSFDVAYEPAADWWDDGFSSSVKDLSEAGFVATRPQVAFLFALEDIDVMTGQDEDRKETLQRGMRGFGVVLDGDKVMIVEVTEPEVHEGYALARYRLVYKPLASVSGVGGAHVSVTVEVSGKNVSAKVGGKSLAATLPRAAQGFSGFAFLHPGYASIDKLKL